MAASDDSPTSAERAGTVQRLKAAFARAREQRAAAAGLRAEGAQARRHARALQDESNVLLEGAVAIVETVLARRGIALAGAVAARFRTDEIGSSGVEVTVRLRDPERVALARHCITERLGESRSDRLIIS